VVSTQFGHVPDVAFEEIRQMRNQQLQQPASLPFFAPTFASNISNPSISSPANNEALYLTSNQTRPAARDIPVNNSTGSIRSRSLAANTAIRPSVAAAPTNVSNPAYQTPLFATNKPAFSTPTRFGISRLNPPPLPTNNALPSGSISSSSSYVNNRNLPISTSPNIRYRTNYHPLPTAVATVSNPSSTTEMTNNAQQRPHYETTYRASFIKPLIP
jgi:hypothetical protein